MLLKSSYQRELNKFCKQLIKGDYNIRQITSGALTQARAKLNPYAFSRLREISVETFYAEAPYVKWHNYRVLAVDGSVVNLPYSASIIQEFGCEKYVTKASGKKSLARCSLLYDVLNHVTVDGQIAGYKTSEKTLLKNHLDLLNKEDLLLGDRGYAYSSIMYWLSIRCINFCFRFHEQKAKVISSFIESQDKERIVQIPLDRREVKSMDVPKGTTITVRLVKVELENGKIEILGTSLLDKEKFPICIFKDLYHKRWGVEEAYKMLKSRIELEDFSGRTARSIHQDFQAKILMMTLCAVMSHPIEQKVREEYSAAKRSNKYDQQINRTDALAETRSNLIAILLLKQKQKILEMMDKIILASRTIIRPGRSNKRLKKVSKRKALNYKRL